ncbi:hypothetical protein D9M69_660570 [compost metagenome]
MYLSDDPILRAQGQEAFRRISQELHDAKLELYLERLRQAEARSAAGKSGANARWGKREESSIESALGLIASLAACTDRWGLNLSAKELWPEFYSGLDQLGVAPEEHGADDTTNSSRITWAGNPGGMQFSTFKKQLSIARGESKK